MGVSSADWITLDLSGLFTLFACWALGLGFAVAALTFGVKASLVRSSSERAPQIWRAAVCALLAPGLGLLLPILLTGNGKALTNTSDSLAIFWAPGLALAAGFVVSRIGRKE